MGNVQLPTTLESYLETHYQVVSAIEAEREKEDNSQFYAAFNLINDTQGSGGFWELAKSITDKFEKMNEGRKWDGEYFDELDQFIHDELIALPV